MDTAAFDAFSRRLSRELSRRGVIDAGVGALTTAVLTAALARDTAPVQAKKKKKKKKAAAQAPEPTAPPPPPPAALPKAPPVLPPSPPCLGVQENCQFSFLGPCCDGLTCMNNGCNFDKVCCRPQGGACLVTCDCCPGLGCDERHFFTCETCKKARGNCETADECCRSDHLCAENSCDASTVKTCCGPPRSKCESVCDCCDLGGDEFFFTRCGKNACGDEPVCCVFVGACSSDCDCCTNFHCQAGECVGNGN